MRKTADVVIVGGGCMGASVACQLAHHGITDIVLVEREAQLGTGSTGRNAGGVRHQFSTEPNIRLSVESIAAFERFGNEFGASIDLHQDGYLFLLCREADVTMFQASADLRRRLGVPVEWLTAAAAARIAPGVSVDGVLAETYCVKDGIAEPTGVTGDPAERAGFETTVGWDFLAEAVEAGVMRLPALADAVVSHAWAGLCEMTPDAMPIIGPAGGCEGFCVIAGFSGHGFLHSPAAEGHFV
jgi:glycine/D-amino acid oxidase-like deaminating enzyme